MRARVEEGEHVTKAFFGKVMWVGRATTFCVGLAVVLVVAFGVGTTALAAVPGDPFKLGRANVVDRITTLVGSATGPLLRVDNDGAGTALDLRVGDSGAPPDAKPAPPMSVDSQARVTNLNADELDGKDAEAFLPADAKAKDAEMLDGLDSERFMRRPSYVPMVKSAADSSRHKAVTASCPPKHLAIGASTRITATDSPETGSEVPVGLTASYGGTGGWRVEAQEMAEWEGEWYLRVTPICVFDEPDIVPAAQ
ncbi:MAG: hypothetical protein AVDCRST_MAG01-01-2292 [uncultured Rubrobacteraceae bacterium]|uniref:Uncharacterized protein n=1 Tax=uncultured Rubrobacteraceae bacterium TaxID=349277 RepID=A0A6J4PQG1_9ACTN|nr:MAG: hypothetical protein AVDCRST_MAG01-01-2292 [uncultured Rubrobacteraceae bacterium]